MFYVFQMYLLNFRSYINEFLLRGVCVLYYLQISLNMFFSLWFKSLSSQTNKQSNRLQLLVFLWVIVLNSKLPNSGRVMWPFSQPIPEERARSLWTGTEQGFLGNWLHLQILATPMHLSICVRMFDGGGIWWRQGQRVSIDASSCSSRFQFKSLQTKDVSGL